MKPSPARPVRRLAALALAAALACGAGPETAVRVDDWTAAGSSLSDRWSAYPSSERIDWKQPPRIVLDGARPVLELATEAEPMRLGRPVTVNLRQTPVVTWEWKPLVLPERGDVRHRALNDQVGRLMIVFEGMKGLAYVWDTTAPVGTRTEPDPFEFFQRILVVVRSGPGGLGQWDRVTRDVARDYRRLFEDEPRLVKWVGLESHSNDTRTRSAVRFGAVTFTAR